MEIVAKHIRSLKGRKIVVVTGAGISVASGIPDFRSSGGMYERYGEGMFHSDILRSPETGAEFFNFVREMKRAAENAEPSLTHTFITELDKAGKLLRWYTQNIDGLEIKAGVSTERLVQLHGDLSTLECDACRAKLDFEPDDYPHDGPRPECSQCISEQAQRRLENKRIRTIGKLRPKMVLYDEPHPDGDGIARKETKDLNARPKMLLVVGTSLAVHGLKRLVKDFAKHVRENGGISVLINATAPRKEWKSIFDHMIIDQCDRVSKVFLKTLTAAPQSRAQISHPPKIRMRSPSPVYDIVRRRHQDYSPPRPRSPSPVYHIIHRRPSPAFRGRSTSPVRRFKRSSPVKLHNNDNIDHDHY